MKPTVLAFSMACMILAASPALAVGEKAAADIKGRDGKDLGTVSVVETTSGVLLKIKLKGLPPGPHGFHVHDTRKCEGDFASAGAIYNPLGAKHGFLNDEGPMAGDFDVEMLSPFITLNKDAEESVFDADGTSFVIFEKADNYTTDPDGGTGARIACGSLTAAKN